MEDYVSSPIQESQRSINRISITLSIALLKTMASAPQSIYLAHREVWEKKIAEHMKTVNPKWISVGKFTASHLGYDQEIVGTVINQIADAGLPPIACAAVQAKFLALTATRTRPPMP
jgi:hypothetical protein